MIWNTSTCTARKSPTQASKSCRNCPNLNSFIFGKPESRPPPAKPSLKPAQTRIKCSNGKNKSTSSTQKFATLTLPSIWAPSFPSLPPRTLLPSILTAQFQASQSIQQKRCFTTECWWRFVATTAKPNSSKTPRRTWQNSNPKKNRNPPQNEPTPLYADQRLAGRDRLHLASALPPSR